MCWVVATFDQVHFQCVIFDDKQQGYPIDISAVRLVIIVECKKNGGQVE